MAAPSTLLTGHDDLAQQKWAAWRRKTDVEAVTLAVLSDQLAEVCLFLDPIFTGGLSPASEWNPTEQSWR